MMSLVISATGMGSWPGTEPREAIVTIRDLLIEDVDRRHLPYLPAPPARGPGADSLGRGAGLLTEMPVELQPSGWRLTSRPGRDLERTASLWRQDLDELTEAYDGYTGPLKIAVAGPWTLASSVELPGGERAIVDLGAAREVTESLADGIRSLLGNLARLIPGAAIIVQLAEPSLPAVLAGTIPTASGYGRLRAVEAQAVIQGLELVLEQSRAAGAAGTVIHCCDRTAPIPVLRQSGAQALALDLTEASPARWESVAATLEAGTQVYAGLVATDPGTTEHPVRDIARGLLDQADRVGIEPRLVQDLVVSPACGLAGMSREAALRTQRAAGDLAAELTELAGSH